METSSRWRWELRTIVFLCCVGVTGSLPALAQKSLAAGSVASPSSQDMSSLDAQRGAFDRFLDSHPEIASDVVANPYLLSNAGFLRAHPELQAFLDSHAPVKDDPRAFLSPRAWRIEAPRMELAEFMSDLPALLAFISFLLAVLWLLRSFWENRRWNRSLKMHEELHTKLMEKFASGQDFSAYMQSEAGRGLLEWTPPVADMGSRGLPNPFGRILWSLQAGLVLLVMGLGLLIIRGHMGASDASALLVLGTLSVTLGAGFALSALVSYGLSKRLGLIAEAGQSVDLMAKH